MRMRTVNNDMVVEWTKTISEQDNRTTHDTNDVYNSEIIYWNMGPGNDLTYKIFMTSNKNLKHGMQNIAKQNFTDHLTAF